MQKRNTHKIKKRKVKNYEKDYLHFIDYTYRTC